MTQPTFSVSDFLASVNQTLEYAYPTVVIEGEVASFKINQNKFVFFDIKDDESSLGCFMTVWQLRMPIEDGMKVAIVAQPKLTKWGKFSLTVQTARPIGEGNLKKSFDLLKTKLENEGLFAAGRKRALPSQPERIAIISSTDAAGYADFIKILNERWGGLAVEVAHTQVQGEVAADQMIRALKYFNEQADLADVVVMIRGGGSADDLSAFNDEQLVREIASSRIPTLVGVGHEIDVTLADLAADVRAATPSNAAQIVTPDKREITSSVRQQVRTIAHVAERAIDVLIQDTRARLYDLLERIDTTFDHWIDDVVRVRSTLRAYDPDAVLRRGYALVRGEVEVGRPLVVETTKNLITTEVKDVKNK